MEVVSSDRVTAVTAKVAIRRRGPLTISPQVYGSNLEPYLQLPEHQVGSERALEWSSGVVGYGGGGAADVADAGAAACASTGVAAAGASAARAISSLSLLFERGGGGNGR